MPGIIEIKKDLNLQGVDSAAFHFYGKQRFLLKNGTKNCDHANFMFISASQALYTHHFS